MTNTNAYKVLVTTSHGEIISHTEATTWDVDEAGRLFLYTESATRVTAVAAYNANAWAAITRVTEEVYREVIGTDKANRRKLQGH